MVITEPKYKFPHKKRMQEDKYQTSHDCCTTTLPAAAHGHQLERRPPAAPRHRLTFINVPGEDIYLHITDNADQPPLPLTCPSIHLPLILYIDNSRHFAAFSSPS